MEWMSWREANADELKVEAIRAIAEQLEELNEILKKRRKKNK